MPTLKVLLSNAPPLIRAAVVPCSDYDPMTRPCVFPHCGLVPHDFQLCFQARRFMCQNLLTQTSAIAGATFMPGSINVAVSYSFFGYPGPLTTAFWARAITTTQGSHYPSSNLTMPLTLPLTPTPLCTLLSPESPS